MEDYLYVPKKSVFLMLSFFIFIQANSIAYSQTFTDSNLPIVIIDSYSQDIDNAWQEKIMGMKVIDNGVGNRNYITDPPNNYNGNVFVDLRGSSTLMFPKKSWNIKTIDASQNEFDVALFGFPKEHDWVFRALYQDKTFLRDELAFKIHRGMGHYSSRTKFFELVVDGDYRGVYQVEEKVKRDPERLDLAKLDLNDITGDALTGGYIIKLDRPDPGAQGWYSGFPSNSSNDSANYFEYYYPNPDSMVQVQKDYIKNYFDRFESTLKSSYWNDSDSGYSKYIHVASFIDNFIVNELSRNTDGYRLSTYFYKDKDSNGDGKLYCGPVWDYNIAWANCSGSEGDNPAGWQYSKSFKINYIPFWWKKLLTDNAFQDELMCRYQNHRKNILNENYLYAHIDSMANYLDESQQRNFQKWPIMGTPVYPQPSPAPADYAGEITNIKNWIQQRLTWLDGHIPGICQNAGIDEDSIVYNVEVYPNPFRSKTTFRGNLSTGSNVSLKVVDIMGRDVAILLDKFLPSGEFQIIFDKAQIPSGIYFYQFLINDIIKSGKIIIQ